MERGLASGVAVVQHAGVVDEQKAHASDVVGASQVKPVAFKEADVLFNDFLLEFLEQRHGQLIPADGVPMNLPSWREKFTLSQP